MNRFIKAFRKVRQTFNEMPRGSAVGGTFRHALFVLLLLIAGVGSAWADTWDGLSVATGFASGSGTEKDPYVISNASEFAYFGQNMKEKTWYVKLGDDISLNDKEWTYGENNTSGVFKGHFDGNGKTISKLKIVPTSTKNNGLFCELQGEVKNLVIESATIAPTAKQEKNTKTGILAGKVGSKSLIENVTVKNSNITYNQDISDDNLIGAIAGDIDGDSKVVNCTVSKLAITSSKTTTNAYFGGLIGRINGQTTITNCSSTDVTVTYNASANASRISGLVGYAKGAAGAPTTISGCTVKDTKVSLTKGISKSCYIGALVAQTLDNTQITGTNTVDSPVVTIDGKLDAASYVGGAIGDFAGASGKVSDIDGLKVVSPSVTVNSVTANDSYIGAVFGRLNTYCDTKNVTVSDPKLVYKAANNPNVPLNLGSFAGGIVGTGAKENSVTAITITGAASLKMGTASTSEIKQVKAGMIGYSNTNVRLENWTINASNKIAVEGSLTTSASHIGGFVGHTLPQNAIDAKFVIKDINFKSSNAVEVSGNVAVASNIGGFVGYMQGRSKSGSVNSLSVTLPETKITIGNLTIKDTRIGGLVGRVDTGCSIDGSKVTSPTIEIKGNVGAACLIGGAIGDFNGGNGFPSKIKTLTVSSPKITVNNYSAGTSMTGGVFGRVSTYSEIDGVALTGVSLNSTKDLSVAQQIGTFAGTITGNATQQISVKNVTIDKSDLTFGSSDASNTVGLKAGIIGQVSTNVLIDTWTVTGNSSVKVNGNLITTASQLGNFAGYVTGAASSPVSIKNVTMSGNASTVITGGVSIKECNIGGAIGKMITSDNINAPVEVANFKINGTTNVSIGKDVSVATYVGGFTSYYAGAEKAESKAILKDISLGETNISVGGQIKTGSYFGGLIGFCTTGCEFQNLSIKSPKLTFGDIAAASYIGGAIGDFIGKKGYTSKIDTLVVTSPTITVKKYSKGTSLTGGVFGRVSTVTAIDGVKLNGAALKFTEDLTVDQQIGTFAGTITGDATQQISVKNVTIDKSELTFGSTDASNTAGLRAGIIGQVSTNVLLDTWKVSGNSSVKVNGNLITKGSQLGNFAGYVAGAASSPVSIKNVTMSGNVSTVITGGVSIKDCKIGGAIGQMTTSDNINAPVEVSDFKIEGTTNVSIGKDVGVALYVGGFTSSYTGAEKTNSKVILNDISLGETNISVGGQIKTGSYFGGLIGYCTTGCEFQNLSIKSPKLTFGDIAAASYIGGAIGDFIGKKGYTSKIDTLEVTSPTITVKKYSAGTSLTGGVFGRVSTFTAIDGVKLNGAALKFTEDLTVAQQIGTFAGTITGDKTQQNSVKNVTIDKSELTFGSLNTSSTVGLKAGVIGQVSTNVLLDTWTVEGNSSVTVNGTLKTTSSNLGGFAGYVTTGVDAPVTIKNIKIKGDAKVSVTGNIEKAAEIGGVLGYVLEGDNAVYTPINISDVSVNGTAAVSVGGNVTEGSYFGGLAGYTLGKNVSHSPIIINNVTLAKTDVAIAGTSSVVNYYGGLVGYANTGCEFSNMKITDEGKVTLGGNVNNKTYVGAGFGNLTGVAACPSTATGIKINNPKVSLNANLTSTMYIGGLAGYQNISTVKESSVTGGEIVLNGNNTGLMYVGGAVGYLNPTVAPYATVQQVEVKNTKIRTEGTHTYAKEKKDLVVGGVVGYMGQSDATTISQVLNCVADGIDINLSGFVPEAANTSGSLYNQYRNAFVVGGVIGRINTPKSLPETLYFSGKIYAPNAMVGPIVGVFLKNIEAADYAYDDYTGLNAGLSADEWQKASNWKYGDYKLGVKIPNNVKANTKQKFESIDGIDYLTITSTTFEKTNEIGSVSKLSKTVLYYTAHGNDKTENIYPSWNTNTTTYPAYYMYYMQGVNRGEYDKDVKIDDIIATPTLAFEFVDESQRGFCMHNLSVKKIVEEAKADSYKWYVNGVVKQEGSDNAYSINPIVTGDTIKVEIYNGANRVETITRYVRPVLRVRNATLEATTFGTKDNPYVLGGDNGVKELLLLSYLSTLEDVIPWEGEFNSSDHYNKAYYELETDIDMQQVADFTPISFPKNGVRGYRQDYVFDGVFNGNYHTIKNLKQNWYAGMYDINELNIGWGLFSVIGNPSASIKVGDKKPSSAEVKNLVIDGAVLTHKTDNTSFYYNNGTSGNANNCMVGVLAGIVTDNAHIENIEIRNSRITDDGSTDYSLAAKGLFVGGAIGSMQSAYNAVNPAIVNTKINHVAAQVGIELTHVAFANDAEKAQICLFNIGGIIGRYCAASASYGETQAVMPAYTLYSGTVLAPKAWISPVLASLRYKDQYVLEPAQYSKQYDGNNNTDASQITIANAQYYNYIIRDRLMTDFYPQEECQHGSRTIVTHVDGSESVKEYNTFKYQGVNYGARCLDQKETSLELLNENMDEGYNWRWDEDGDFVHMTTDPYIGVSLSRGDDLDFTANLEGITPKRYTWKFSLDGNTWKDIVGQGEATYTGHTSLQTQYIRVIVWDGSKEYLSLIETVAPDYNLFKPEIVRTDKDDANKHFTINMNPQSEVPEELVIEYQWYTAPHNSGLISSEKELVLENSKLEDEYHNTIWAKAIVTDMGKVVAEYWCVNGGTVIFVNGNNYIGEGIGVGDDKNDGLTPEKPVKTINVANSKLRSIDNGGTWDNNFIVIMGVLNSDYDFRSSGQNPATLTGKWNNIDYNGVIRLKEIKPKEGEHTINHVCLGEPSNGTNCYVLGDTKFQYLTFVGNGTDGNCFIECHGNDVWFGKGLEMENFKPLSIDHGNNNGIEIIPELTVVLTASNIDEDKIQEYIAKTVKKNKPQVLTVESGHYGRILAGRYTGKWFPKIDQNTSHSILGSPKNPIWAVINIDIAKDSPNRHGYTRDINCVVGGLTDGSMYADMEINLHGGNIAYVVGGHQGNPIANGTKKYTPIDGVEGEWGEWPNTSYFGRSVINVDENPDLKPLIVNNLYAGGLGRKNQISNEYPAIVDMYVYGRTEINMKAGNIGNNIYAGGAGGVIGLCPWDPHVPYATTEADNTEITAEKPNGILNGVEYAKSGEKGPDAKLVTVTLHKLNDEGDYVTEDLDLSKSTTTLNISGGIINGDVFGGGRGYVPDMPDEAAVQGIGSIFGNTTVTITGGNITRSVYGGSEGDAQFYGKTNKYGQKITHIAETNGTIDLTISGTDEKCPVIHGNIYGGGKGVRSIGTDEYLRIATTGNKDLKLLREDGYPTTVNLTIDLPKDKPFAGNIYGGGEFGLVDGDTNVVLKRGTFTGDVFGGGKGENGHPEKAKVTGSTNVKVGE